MTISNYNNRYVKIQSDHIQEVIENLSDYDSIELEGNINCCTSNCDELVSNYSLELEGVSSWIIDLDTAVKLNNSINSLLLQNIIGLNKVNPITIPIDLGYVEDNCVSTPCTLETFNIYFVPLFKDQIDDFFASIGISSDVTIVFDGNVLIIEDMPEDWMPYSIKYGVAEPYTEIFFGFNDVDSKIFLGSDGLYVSPEFFTVASLISGVYKFTVKMIDENNGYIQESNCAFIDIDTKCKVAAHLVSLKSESLKSDESPTTVAHILHYALTVGSNCGCNCEDLCKIYTELYNLIKNTDPTITSNCGC